MREKGKVLQTCRFANNCLYVQMFSIPVSTFSKRKGSVLLRTAAPGCLGFDVASKSSNVERRHLRCSRLLKKLNVSSSMCSPDPQTRLRKLKSGVLVFCLYSYRVSETGRCWIFGVVWQSLWWETNFLNGLSKGRGAILLTTFLGFLNIMQLKLFVALDLPLMAGRNSVFQNPHPKASLSGA